MILFDEIIPARAAWEHVVHCGETLRIIDLEGNQAVDFLMYGLHDDTERYSVQDTIVAQKTFSALRQRADVERGQAHGADRRYLGRLPRHNRRRL